MISDPDRSSQVAHSGHGSRDTEPVEARDGGGESTFGPNGNTSSVDCNSLIV